MNELMISQMNEFLKAIASVRETLNANTNSIIARSKGFWNIREFARFGRAFMEAGEELRKLNETILNNAVQLQLGSMDVKAAASAIKDLDAIRTDVITRLVHNQTDLLNVFMENGADSLEKLKLARGINDIAAIQMHLFTDIQAGLKEKMIEFLGICEATSTAIKAWNERGIDRIIEAPEVPALTS